MRIQRREFVGLAGCGVAAAFAGCTAAGDEPDSTAGFSGETLTLATTTSTYDTGLLDDLNGAFEDRYGVRVYTVAQGTGAALETGRNGDADVVMVHARTLEDEFLQEGYGVNRRDLMYNDFVVVGDGADPAEIAGVDDVVVAFTQLSEANATFVSRGDGSGTHAKELEIWDLAGVDDFGEWYREVGDGMGAVLFQVDQVGGYTLADRGTYLSMRNEVDLEVHVEGPLEGGPGLLANPYGIIAVDPTVNEGVNYDLAMSYIGYVTGVEGQAIIDEYTVGGERLFVPAARSEEPNFEQYVPVEWERSGETIGSAGTGCSLEAENSTETD